MILVPKSRSAIADQGSAAFSRSLLAFRGLRPGPRTTVPLHAAYTPGASPHQAAHTLFCPLATLRLLAAHLLITVRPNPKKRWSTAGTSTVPIRLEGFRLKT